MAFGLIIGGTFSPSDSHSFQKRVLEPALRLSVIGWDPILLSVGTRQAEDF
jgi:hypothetical protein